MKIYTKYRPNSRLVECTPPHSNLNLKLVKKIFFKKHWKKSKKNFGPTFFVIYSGKDLRLYTLNKMIFDTAFV